MALKDIRDLRNQLIQTSVYSFMGGYGIQLIDPWFRPISVLMECVGVAGAAYYAYTWSKFDRIFRGLDLCVGDAYPIQKARIKTDYSVVYKFTLPAGLCLKDFEDKKEAIENYLGKDIDIKYTYKEIYIEVYKDNKKILYDYDENIKVKGDIAFPIGYDNHGQLITCCLSSGDDNTHMLIASTTGGGKSVLLKGIITYLISKKDIDIYLADLKGCEFSIFNKCRNVKSISIFQNEALSMLLEVSEIMTKRYQTFKKKGVNDIHSYNKKYSLAKMRYIVVAIDEYSELMDSKDCQRELERLSALSRGAGISLIISTQRPDSKVISSRIKCNISVIAGLRTNTDINSRIIFDTDELSKLRGRGHCIFKYSGTDTELQTMYITNEQIKKIIKPYEFDKVNSLIKSTNGNISDTDLANAIGKL